MNDSPGTQGSRKKRDVSWQTMSEASINRLTCLTARWGICEDEDDDETVAKHLED